MRRVGWSRARPEQRTCGVMADRRVRGVGRGRGCCVVVLQGRWGRAGTVWLSVWIVALSAAQSGSFASLGTSGSTRRRLPMAQTSCCCMWSVDGQTVCHGCAHATLCQAMLWRHGDIAQGGQPHCSRWSRAPSYLVWRGAPSEMVQPPPSERRPQRGWSVSRSRRDCGSLFSGRRHHVTWRGWCH
jgi:hypothetical protein